VEMTPFVFSPQMTIPAVGEKFPDIAKMPARQWLGFAVPADTPKSITDRIDAAFAKSMQDEELKATAARIHLNLFGAFGDESMKILTAMESAVSWKLQELGVAKISPETLGIAKP